MARNQLAHLLLGQDHSGIVAKGSAHLLSDNLRSQLHLPALDRAGGLAVLQIGSDCEADAMPMRANHDRAVQVLLALLLSNPFRVSGRTLCNVRH